MIQLDFICFRLIRIWLTGRITFTYVQILLGFYLSFMKPSHNSIPGNSQASVPLRIEEDLAIPDIHRCSMLKIVHGKIVVILRSLQHLEASIIRFEERQSLFRIIHTFTLARLHDIMRVLQFFQRCEDCASARVSEYLAVSLGELPLQFWGNDSFDVHVQFDFWYCEDVWVLIFCE